jgi:hypothetical protein
MLAEILAIPLDPLKIREKEWLLFKNLMTDYEWQGRDYFEYNSFPDYFKKLIDQIVTKFGIYKDIIVQNRSLGHPRVAWGSHMIHKDSYRNSCIVIPFSTITDPVCFYNDSAVKKRDQPPSEPPILRSFYSQNYAMLMNTQVFHNVTVFDKTKPRVFLQVNYDQTYEELFIPDEMKELPNKRVKLS